MLFGSYFESLNFTQHFVIQIGALSIIIIIFKRDCGLSPIFSCYLSKAALHFRRSLCDDDDDDDGKEAA